MSLHEKLYKLRKQNNWSQEELAEKCGVSRQSVSKWESAMSVPELDKILLLSKLFGVTTDYLINDDIDDGEIHEQTEIENNQDKNDNEAISLSIEQAEEYITTRFSWIRKFALAVICCILSPVPMLLLVGMCENGIIGISDDIAAIIGIIIVLLIVTPQVGIFITYGNAMAKYRFLDEEAIKPDKEIVSMAKAAKESFSGYYNRSIVKGVTLCIAAGGIVLFGGIIDEFNKQIGNYAAIFLLAAAICVVAYAVYIFVCSIMKNSTYERLLQENDFSIENKNAAKLTEKLSPIYWSIITAIYLGWSFITFDWHRTWIIWPVSAVLFTAVIGCNYIIARHKNI